MLNPLKGRHLTLQTIQECHYAPYLEAWAALGASASFGKHDTCSLWRNFYADEAERARQRMLYHLRVTPTMAERLQTQKLNH